MKYLTEQRYLTRANGLACLFCLLPQLLRFVLNFISEYAVAGNVAYSYLNTYLLLAADFFGTVSFYAAIAVVIYTVFLYGMRQGGEWIMALIAVYVLSVLLLSVVEDVGFGVVSFAISITATVYALFAWIKGGRKTVTVALATLVVPILSGLVILSVTTVPTADELLASILYGFISLGFEVLLLTVAGRLAAAFRRSAIEKGGANADISLAGKFLPIGNPVLKTMLWTDLGYAIILLISTFVESSTLVKEYGWPVNGQEWFSLFYPYIEVLLMALAGYVVMRLVAGRLEQAFLAAEEEGEAATKHLS